MSSEKIWIWQMSQLVIVRSWGGGGGAVIEDSLNVISFYLIRLCEKKNNRYSIKKKIIIFYNHTSLSREYSL